MNRPTGGGGTTVRPGSPSRPPARPGNNDRTVRQAAAERFVGDLVSEMRRVTWPSRQEWVSATILTIGLVVVVGLYTYVADQLFGLLFSWIHH